MTQKLFFPDSKVKVLFNTWWCYQIQLIILEKMRSCFRKSRAKVLDLKRGKCFGPRWPKSSFLRLQTPRLRYFLKSDNFIGFNFLDKMSFLWKLEIGFWTYGFLSVLGPSGQKLVFRPPNPKVKVFFKI